MAKTPRVIQNRLRELGCHSYEKGARYLVEHGVEISGSYLSMLDRKERDPSVPMVKDLARALGLEVEDLIGK